VQERIFRNLDRDAIQGNLSTGDLDRADKVLRMFKAPGTLDRSWVKAELLADQALSGGSREQLSGSRTGLSFPSLPMPTISIGSVEAVGGL
jgi:hypothetical protein